MGQITATRNLVAIKVVRHAGQSHAKGKVLGHTCRCENWRDELNLCS